MADPRFFHRTGPCRLGDLAELAQATLEGDPDIQIEDVASLVLAGPSDIAYFDHRRFLPDLLGSKAAAVVAKATLADQIPVGKARLLVKDPQLAMALIAAKFYPDEIPGGERREPAVAAGAHVDPTASLGAGVQIEAGAVIGAGVVLGAGAYVASTAVLGRNIEVGAGSRIGAGATLSHCLIGERVVIHPGVRIGQDGFGFAMGLCIGRCRNSAAC